MNVEERKKGKRFAGTAEKNDDDKMKVFYAEKQEEAAPAEPVYGSWSYGNFYAFKETAEPELLEVVGPADEPAELEEIDGGIQMTDKENSESSIIIEDGIFRIRPGLDSLELSHDDTFKELVDSVLK